MPEIIINLTDTMDLSSMEWIPIPASFCGIIDGVHKIILASGNTFADPGVNISNEITIVYPANPVETLISDNEEENFGCTHISEPIFIKAATETEDALLANQCQLCDEILEYHSVPGTACATFLQNTADAILTTSEKEVVADTALWTCLDKKVTDALQARSDVSLTIHYTYKGLRYTVTIPSGTQAAELLDENGYCGFRYLDSLFGGNILDES